jgi:hypothetical protein
MIFDPQARLRDFGHCRGGVPAGQPRMSATRRMRLQWSAYVIFVSYNKNERLLL